MNRKQSREIAMELLFQMTINKETVEDTITNFEEHTDYDIKEVDFSYVKNVLNGVFENQLIIDNTIEKYLVNWKLKRISKINLSILRICTFELLFDDDIPNKVSINEAVELAKKYSEDNSVSFINAVLDRIMKSIEEKI
jgi:transcription antitermination protein NusB